MNKEQTLIDWLCEEDVEFPYFQEPYEIETKVKN